MPILKINELDLRNKRILIREDFNVPLENGHISSDARIRAALPTIQYALQAEAKVMILSHLGRPKEIINPFSPHSNPLPQEERGLSLEPIAECLSHLLHKPVKFIKELNSIDLANGQVVLYENVRFLKGEKENEPVLARKMAALCDIFVMDAFATAHRAEASTYGVAQYAPMACAGLLLAKELEALEKALKNPQRPLIAIIGGSKVSTKLTVLETLITKVDQLIVGGGIANTFLAAANFPIGTSLFEPELIDVAKELYKKNKILLPEDVIVAKEFKADIKGILRSIHEVAVDEMILDIGPKTAQHYAQHLKSAGTILWNGPIGVFEFPAFENGTKTLAKTIAESSAFSIAGGGDTLAAIEKYGINHQLSYISTGGGAFLEFVEGKELPAIKILQERCAHHE